MEYYHLKTILNAGKEPLPFGGHTTAFCVETAATAPYIEPSFKKVIFEDDNPTVLLVSAVGATGKTSLARQLSRDTSLPILDLAAHRPVGENSLTGLLTESFETTLLSEVFTGLQSGSYGLIVDGIDEGRSKTTEQAFEAFLDDVSRRCSPGANNTVVVMLGRSQALEDCWVYLSEKGLSVGMITIMPFSEDQAVTYIDECSNGPTDTPFYEKARDVALGNLARAFRPAPTDEAASFLSFMGYPPVLDAVVAFLDSDGNHYRMLRQLDRGGPGNECVETKMLFDIATHIMEREREHKIVPNILAPVLATAPQELRSIALENTFSFVEQSARLIGYCLEESLSLQTIGEPYFDERYEEQLETVLSDHPFLKPNSRSFRNAVFEALALAHLIHSKNIRFLELADNYIQSHKSSYHLLYMVDAVGDRDIPVQAIGHVLAAALEFRSVQSRVAFRIEGEEWDADQQGQRGSSEIDIATIIEMVGEGGEEQAFRFSCLVTDESIISLGSVACNTFIVVPCPVRFNGPEEINWTAPVEISARALHLSARLLTVYSPAGGGRHTNEGAYVDAGSVVSELELIRTNNLPLVFSLDDSSGIAYPVIGHVAQRTSPLDDSQIAEKYRRFRRILMTFRSHSRGSLARLCDKIDHDRVLKNDVGRSILIRLQEDGIVRKDGRFYFLDSDALAERTGISWHDLRHGRTPDTLRAYLDEV